MHRTTIRLTALLACALTPLAAAQSTYVQLVLDASGSMYTKLPDGTSRITTARSVLSDFINRLPDTPDLNVGLRVYGANSTAAAEGACQDSKLVLPMKGVARRELLDTVARTDPRGATPIAYSLEQAALDFPQDDSRKLIVLVTDGQESCRGNVKATLDAFKRRGITVDLRIVGIDLDDNAQRSFAGVGTLENARSGAELASALGRAVEQVAAPAVAALPVTVTLTSGGQPARGGANVTFVPALGEQGTAFTLEQGEYRATLKPGSYTARVESAESGVQSFAGLSVATGAENRFTFEVGAVTPVKLDVTPQPATAGGQVTVQFSNAPAGTRNWVALAAPNSPDSAYQAYSNVSGATGSATLSVPEDASPLEARYLLVNPDGSTRVVGRSAPFTPRLVTASVSAPAEAAAGGTVQVTWTGPNNAKDYVTVVAKGAPEGSYLDYRYTRDGNPLTIKLPTAGGDYELRYASDLSGRTLATAPIHLTMSSYALDAPDEATAGTDLKVRWTGPNNARDYITVVKKGAPVGTYLSYFYTANGNPATLHLPLEPGEYELRYSTEAASPNPTLASRPLRLTAGQYSVKGPREAKAGSSIQVQWSGPNGRGDYITIVKKGAPVGTYLTYFYTANGNPGTLRLPTEPGEYELRYSTEAASPNPTLASEPITLK